MTTVPFLDLKPQYKALEKPINDRIQKVLNHGQFILGPEVEECEKALAEFIGSKYCLTAASGTDALMLILMALGVGPGDEVITSSFSFFATAEVISLVGATPVFGDIDPITYNLSPKGIEKLINKKTKAIMPVSLYGQPADFNEFNEIGKRYSIPIIEDAAQSFGANYNGKRSCNLSEFAGTSFFPAKPLGCYGDGGAVFTTNAEVFERMKEIRVHGQASRYHHTRIGINGRLDTIQCAILIEKLKRYESEIKSRDRIASTYSKAFSELKNVSYPKVMKDRGSVWAQYTIAVSNRDAFVTALKEVGVPSSVHYPKPIHRQPVYSSLKNPVELPEADKAASQVLSLPMFPDMTEEQVQFVIDGVRKVAGK